MHAVIAELKRILGADAVVSEPDALRTYDADASMLVAHPPEVVALPATPAQAAATVRCAAAAGLPIVARGAGTGIAGGAVPLRGGLLLSTARMDRIEAIEPRSRRALVGAGVVNAELNARLAPLGLQFAPDPSSQRASTIGGNLATNAGGPHCLKYGVTTNHILAVELACPDGSLRWTSDGVPEAAGYDLTGLVVGSEGTFGVVTRALVRLTPLPEENRVVLALFPSVVAASAAVSTIIAAGSLPTSLEVMDHNGLRAVNGAYGLGLPEAAGTTLLIIEVDGVADGLDEILAEILELCRAQGAFELRPARTPAEQARVWTARKAVAGAIGRLAPAYLLVDTVVPRTRLPLMMEEVERLSHELQMEVCNVFHAGDGNLHPLVLYDPRDTDQRARAHALASAVLKLSIEQGGVISGEHGIGIEKQEYLPLLFNREELQLQAAIYHCFNPDDRFNPGKIFPMALQPRDLARERRARMQRTAPVAAGQVDAAALAGLVGADHLLADEAGLCVAPPSIEALSRVVAHCHATGVSMVPLGQPGPHDAPAPGLRIATRRLARVRTYEPDDLTIGVEAGMTLAELQAVLATHGQMLPLDIHAPEAATLGALVASAADGPRRLGYGTLRDWLLGLTVVEADGTVVRLGAQVVKNVSGYDLVKLFVGSHGTLGVIAALSLRVFPQPRAAATLVASFASRAAAMACLDNLADSRLQPTAAELVQGLPMAPGVTLPPGGALLALRAEGHPAAVARHMADLRLMAAAAGALHSHELADTAEAALWQALLRQTAPPADPDASLARLCAAPADLGAALDDAEAEAAARGLTMTLCARGLSGVAYLQLAGPASARLAWHAALVARLRHVQLHDRRLAARAAHPWGAPPPAIALMRAIKAELDPYERLHPGALNWRVDLPALAGDHA